MGGTSANPARPRLDMVDRLRGLVMVLMALDHVRDYYGDVSFNAVEPSITNAPVFFTRWITHFCAPTFIFLTGVGAYLYGQRGRNRLEVASYLFTRGLWIAAIEIFFISPTWQHFDFSLHLIGTGVLWAIGACMMLMALLVFLPRAALIVFGLLLIESHNLFDGFWPGYFGDYWWVWRLLHHQGPIRLSDQSVFVVGYPLVPWLGVMAVGYGFGPILQLPRSERASTILGLGAALTIGFLILRGFNYYGDPRPWTLESDETHTIFSFLNCHKYPPSLCYVMMTLGPALLMLAAFDNELGLVGDMLTVFGRVPMFYYLLHLPLIVGSSHLALIVGKNLNYFNEGTESRFMNGAGLGLELTWVYLAWVIVLAILFPPCWWFAGIKQRYRWGWLSFL